jgi:hypothetical protein
MLLVEGCWDAPVSYTSGGPELFPLNKTNLRIILRGKVVVGVVKPLLGRIFLIAVAIEISASLFTFYSQQDSGGRSHAPLLGDRNG